MKMPTGGGLESVEKCLHTCEAFSISNFITADPIMKVFLVTNLLIHLTSVVQWLAHGYQVSGPEFEYRYPNGTIMSLRNKVWFSSGLSEFRNPVQQLFPPPPPPPPPPPSLALQPNATLRLQNGPPPYPSIPLLLLPFQWIDCVLLLITVHFIFDVITSIKSKR